MKKLILMVAVLVLFAGQAVAFENVTPTDAYLMATTDANTYILDVRTLEEWQWVGHPGANKLGEGAELEGKVVNVSFKIEYKGNFIVNPSFNDEINESFPNPADVTLITMCRSGKRSVAAALALEALGYNMKNMVTGYQGGKTDAGYRAVNGWVIDGLPYSYSGEGYED